MADVITLIEQDHRAVERLFEQLRTGTGERRQLLADLELLLLPHTEAEEQAVYPTMEQAGLDSFDRAEADEEHDEANRLLEQLKVLAESGDDATFRTTLDQLVDAVNHHVEEEEQEMLPELRATCDGDVLERLGERFQQAKTAIMTAVHDSRADRPRGEVPTPPTTTDQLLDLTKEELYEKAKALDVDGRSKMTKDQLARAVSRAG